MSQHDGTIANADGATVRADIQSAIQALLTQSLGTSAPATTYAGQVWADTTNHVLKRRNEANSGWSIIDTLDTDRVLSLSAAYTVQVRDVFKLIEGDTTGGAFTVTLPPVANVSEGVQFEFKNTGTGSNALTIDGNGAETINGSATLALSDGQSANVWCDGAAWRALVVGQAASALPRGYRSGLALSNNATDPNNDIDIAVGACRDSTDTYDLALSSALTKRLDAAWAAGTNAGGLFSGTKAASTWYHVFLIRKDSDGSIDAGFDTSVTAANIPAGYTAYRRIGSVLTDGSGNILAFTQIGERFQWSNPPLDVGGTSSTTGRTLRTLSVPLGVKVLATIQIYLSAGVSGVAIVTSPDETDVAPSVSAARGNVVFGPTPGDHWMQLHISTNTSGQIGVRTDVSATERISTVGWLDFLEE